MTFGITSLLELIWDHQQPLLAKGLKPSPQMIEICASLERALAYAHTGNAKVMSAGVMRPLWLIRSLLDQGLPTLSPMLRIVTETTGTLPVAVSPAQWPTVTRFNVPATASKRTQMLTYSLEHYEVCISTSCRRSGR
jgi:hypothetical protein